MLKDPEVLSFPHKKMDYGAGEDDNILFATCYDDILYVQNEGQQLISNRHEKNGYTKCIVKQLKNVRNNYFFNSIMKNLLEVDGIHEHFIKPTEFLKGQ